MQFLRAITKHALLNVITKSGLVRETSGGDNFSYRWKYRSSIIARNIALPRGNHTDRFLNQREGRVDFSRAFTTLVRRDTDNRYLVNTDRLFPSIKHQTARLFVETDKNKIVR